MTSLSVFLLVNFDFKFISIEYKELKRSSFSSLNV